MRCGLVVVQVSRLSRPVDAACERGCREVTINTGAVIGGYTILRMTSHRYEGHTISWATIESYSLAKLDSLSVT